MKGITKIIDSFIPHCEKNPRVFTCAWSLEKNFFLEILINYIVNYKIVKTKNVQFTRMWCTEITSRRQLVSIT